ncbi:MAG: hypothetical protein L0Y64_04370 [Myxococcaceae bacterium]|nr:hypothetical protein [Myxococcaceae bacterium]
MVFFPLFLQALWEVTLVAAGRRALPSRRVLLLSAAATVVAFAAVKAWHPAGELYRRVLGLLQWPPRAALALLTGAHLPGLVPVSLVRDATDLIALPAVGLGVLAGHERAGPAGTEAGKPVGDVRSNACSVRRVSLGRCSCMSR